MNSNYCRQVPQMLFLNSMQIHSNAKFNNFLYIFEHLHYFLVLLHDFQFSLALKKSRKTPAYTFPTQENISMLWRTWERKAILTNKLDTSAINLFPFV